MHAFDFILMLFSFVYAAAVTHVLSMACEKATTAAISESGAPMTALFIGA